LTSMVIDELLNAEKVGAKRKGNPNPLFKII
jgi:hypothetical protein